MRRLMVRLWLVVLLVVVLGMAALGLFPPSPKTQPVQHVLPTDKFTGH